MIKSVEASGNTIDAAIEAALSEIGKERDEVTVEIIEKPKTGFLGIGNTKAKVRVSFDQGPEQKARDFLAGLLERFDVNAEIKIEEGEDDTLNIELIGENMSPIIGRRGNTLDAMQYITSLVVNKDEEKYYHIVLDTQGYREKREEALRKLANKIADKVVKYKRNMTLEPMNPYERRIIHSALQGNKNVTTYSVGSEPNRKVVVALAGAKKDGAPRDRKPAKQQ